MSRSAAALASAPALLWFGVAVAAPAVQKFLTNYKTYMRPMFETVWAYAVSCVRFHGFFPVLLHIHCLTTRLYIFVPAPGVRYYYSYLHWCFALLEKGSRQ